jgi:hypothetical protein
MLFGLIACSLGRFRGNFSSFNGKLIGIYITKGFGSLDIMGKDVRISYILDARSHRCQVKVKFLTHLELKFKTNGTNPSSGTNMKYVNILSL